MKKAIITIFAVSSCITVLSSCSASKGDIGTVAGGAGGAALGYAVSDSALGAAVGGGAGALLGKKVGESMED